MSEKSYLQWLAQNTVTKWWHDSADPAEIRLACEHDSVGATTNPVLAAATLASNKEFWKKKIGIIPDDISGDERAEFILKNVVRYVADIYLPQYEATNGEDGYVCAQVSPFDAACRESMIQAARKYASWAPNISVKFPATLAGMDALEECIAEGISITSTVNFSVPQVIQVAQRYQKGKLRAEQNGKKPGQCFAVIMIGRIDDYLRDVANDNNVNVSEDDINQAGIAITKRAYSIFKQRGYDPKLLVAALRGTHHMTELAGGDLIMSIHPKYQAKLLEPGIAQELRIDEDVPQDVIERLKAMPEFVKAYEPDGMKPSEFISFGVAQKTLSQFCVAGWNKILSAGF